MPQRDQQNDSFRDMINTLDKKLDLLIVSIDGERRAGGLFREATSRQLDSHESRIYTLEIARATDSSLLEDVKKMKSQILTYVLGGILGMGALAAVVIPFASKLMG